MDASIGPRERERRPGVSEPEGPDGQRGHSLAALATPMRFLTA